MTTAVAELLGLARAHDPHDYRLADVWDLQRAAANERFERAQESIPALHMLASKLSLSTISEKRELAALAFPHTLYKSYTRSTIDDGRWDVLTAWLDSLSINRVVGTVDLEGVEDLPTWMDRLHRAGHFVFTSSGTTGTVSILNQGQADRDALGGLVVADMGWATGAVPDQRRPAFVLFPSRAQHNVLTSYLALLDAYSRPEVTYWLTDQPSSFRDMYELSDPGLPVAAPISEAFDRLVDRLVEHRLEPAMILGFGPLHLRVAQRLELRGVAGLHPDSAVQAGSQTKGLDVPDDYLDRIEHAYGVPKQRYWAAYGMVETPSQMPRCDQGRYHIPPWIIALVLDHEGREMVAPVGDRVEGRMALLDIAVDGRWGALVSGDHVVVNTGRCDCGRSGATVTEATRYTDRPEGDVLLARELLIEAYVHTTVHETLGPAADGATSR